MPTPASAMYIYTLYGQSGACYYDGDDDCDFYAFDPVTVTSQTAVPQITTLSKTSDVQGSSGTFTVQGRALVDNFGYSVAKIYASGVTVNVQNSNPYNPNSVAVQCSIAANAPLGDQNSRYPPVLG